MEKGEIRGGGGVYIFYYDVKKIGKRQNNGEGMSLKRV